MLKNACINMEDFKERQYCDVKSKQVALLRNIILIAHNFIYFPPTQAEDNVDIIYFFEIWNTKGLIELVYWP